MTFKGYFIKINPIYIFIKIQFCHGHRQTPVCRKKFFDRKLRVSFPPKRRSTEIGVWK